MAGTLTVQNLQGPTSGANANKIIIPSGQTLHAAGHVVQVVQAASTTKLETTTPNVWYDCGAVLSITPTSSTSKIYLSNSATGIVRATANISIGLRLLRNVNGGGWDVVTQRSRHGYWGSAINTYTSVHYGMEYLDSPNTALTTQYKIQLYLTVSGSNVRYNDTENLLTPNTSESTLIAQEIAQ